MTHWVNSTRHWSIMFMKCILYPWWKEMAVKGRTGNDDGDDACAEKLALDNIGRSRTERKSSFPMSLTSSSSSRDRNKYGGIWSSRSTSSRDALSADCDPIYRRVLLFVCGANHIPLYLLLSLQDDDDVRDIGKRDFRPVILRPMLSNAKRSEHEISKKRF